jgi:hypothetical protein
MILGERMRDEAIVFAATAALLLGSVACSSENPESPQTEAYQEHPVSDAGPASDGGMADDFVGLAAQREALGDSAEASDASPTDYAGEYYAIDFGTPVTWTENGVSLSITGMTIADARATDFPSSPVPRSDLATLLPGTRTVVLLRMTAANECGQAIDYFPASGWIEILGEEVQSSALLSDKVGGREWPTGTSESGVVLWLLEYTSFVDAFNARSLAFTQPEVYFAESWEELAGKAEIVVRW